MATIIEHTACFVLGHQFGEYRKIMRQWRKRATCQRCGKLSIKILTPAERKPYEEREERDRRAKLKAAQTRQKTEQQTRQRREKNAESAAGNDKLRAIAKDISTPDSRTTGSEPPTAA